MQVVYELAPVIGDVIAAHCPDTATCDRSLCAQCFVAETDGKLQHGG